MLCLWNRWKCEADILGVAKLHSERSNQRVDRVGGQTRAEDSGSAVVGYILAQLGGRFHFYRRGAQTKTRICV